ncbi:MAG: hypothetical protein ACTSWG_10580 [Candidatus Helarchaeota archaeon]
MYCIMGIINNNLNKRGLIMDRKAIIWDYLINNGIATERELQLVTCINGYSEDTLNNVIYAKTAYRCLEQLKENY